MSIPFALWMTGLPGSGKSTITKALVALLHRRDVDPVVLESDVFRKYFTPHATHSEEDRVLFYQGMVEIASRFIDHGVPVIFDATGNRRSYRTPARECIGRFAEVLVECPLEICMERDPKGIYRKAKTGAATTVPGLQVDYEPPGNPEVRILSDREDPEAAARKILDFLIGCSWVPSKKAYRV
jgi:adenylylsulfate kinase